MEDSERNKAAFIAGKDFVEEHAGALAAKVNPLSPEHSAAFMAGLIAELCKVAGHVLGHHAALDVMRQIIEVHAQYAAHEATQAARNAIKVASGEVSADTPHTLQ